MLSSGQQDSSYGVLIECNTVSITADLAIL
jgi:hypothetical protein